MTNIRSLVVGVYLLLAGSAALAEPTDDQALEQARRLLKRAILVDGHNDLPWAVRTDTRAKGDVSLYDLRVRTPGDTDIERLKRGLVGAQFWSVYTPGETATAYARTHSSRSTSRGRLLSAIPKCFDWRSQ